jgi:hypothetical protein
MSVKQGGRFISVRNDGDESPFFCKTRDLPRHTAGEIWKASSEFLERASRVFGVHTE